MGIRDELAESAKTFDNILARLQAAFKRQRQLVAEPVTQCASRCLLALAACPSQMDITPPVPPPFLKN